MIKSDTFTRTPFTWLCYLMLGYYAMMQTTLSILIPFLRAELGLSYTVGSLVLSAVAIGILLVGVFGHTIVRAWGRQTLFWRAALGVSLGSLVIAFSPFVGLTFVGAILLGLAGSSFLITVQSSLSDYYREQRTVAFVESNAIASLTNIFAPLWISLTIRVGLGWRMAVVGAILMAVLLWLRWGRLPFPIPHAQAKGRTDGQGSLPLHFWVYGVALFLGVAIEWSFIGWSATYLQAAAGMTTTEAASWMSLYFLAMLTGRLVGSRLARFLPSPILQVISFFIILLGFPFFWLAAWTPLRLAGLFVAGLGVANTYPSLIANATRIPSHLIELGMARLALISGAAVLSVPFVLGWLADSFGLAQALSIVLALILAALGVTWLANRLAYR